MLFGLGYVLTKAAVRVSKLCGAEPGSEFAVAMITASIVGPADPIGTYAAVSSAALEAKAHHDGPDSTAAKVNHVATLGEMLLSRTSVSFDLGPVDKRGL
jgi:hypothetical protein